MISALGAWFAATPAAIRIAKWAGMALVAILLVLSIRRGGERAGRLVERLENMEIANDVNARMREAAARRPRDRDELVGLLRDDEF